MSGVEGAKQTETVVVNGGCNAGEVVGGQNNDLEQVKE